MSYVNKWRESDRFAPISQTSWWDACGRTNNTGLKPALTTLIKIKQEVQATNEVGVRPSKSLLFKSDESKSTRHDKEAIELPTPLHAHQLIHAYTHMHASTDHVCRHRGLCRGRRRRVRGRTAHPRAARTVRTLRRSSLFACLSSLACQGGRSISIPFNPIVPHTYHTPQDGRPRVQQRQPRRGRLRLERAHGGGPGGDDDQGGLRGAVGAYVCDTPTSTHPSACVQRVAAASMFV